RLTPAEADAALPTEVRCCLRLRALRSAPPITGSLHIATDSLRQSLLSRLDPTLRFGPRLSTTSSNPTVHRHRTARPQRQPAGQHEESEIPKDLPPIVRLPLIHLAATTETATVDRQATDPRLRDRGEQHEHQ